MLYVMRGKDGPPRRQEKNPPKKYKAQSHHRFIRPTSTHSLPTVLKQLNANAAQNPLSSKPRQQAIMATNPTAPVTADTNPNPKSNTVYLQDMEELERVFNRFDSNGDGKISVNELDNVLRTLGSGVPPEELQRVMDELDTDHDGFINLPEFAAFCRSDTADGGDSELRDAFDLYDQDKNGLISAAELHLVLNRLGLKCSVEDCHTMIKSVDSDGDGNVNFEEFKQMMSNNRVSANGSAP